MARNKPQFDNAFSMNPESFKSQTVEQKAPDANTTTSKSVPAKRIIKRETRSKRVNLLVKPSTYEAVVAKAEECGVSVNELINSYMEEILGL